MKISPLFEELVRDLQAMPGIGPRSAQRIAYYFLDYGRQRALKLSKTLEKAMDNIGYCKRCNIYSENDYCEICSNPIRVNSKVLCVVEYPADVVAIEQTHDFNGSYFVLHGHLSPIDGIGPKELHLEKLEAIFANEKIEEVILATAPTVEGDATAFFIKRVAEKYNIPCSQLARGIPVGGDLDSLDGNTLSKSIAGRNKI